MKSALLAVAALLLAAGCGGSSSNDSGNSGSSAHQKACQKTARGWVIAARPVSVALGLGDADTVAKALTTMQAAENQMEIDECKGALFDAVRSGDLELIAANRLLQECTEPDPLDCTEADASWSKKDGGEYWVLKVQLLAFKKLATSPTEPSPSAAPSEPPAVSRAGERAGRPIRAPQPV